MIRVLTALVSTALGLALLLSFKAHSAGAPKSALAGATRASGSDSGSGGSGGSDTATPAPGGSTKRPRASSHTSHTSHTARPAGTSGTFTGDPADTPYGTMQVTAVVRAGKLTDVGVLQETDGGRSHQIDDASIPILRSEALSAQGANIDVVSGATFTSQGYAQSLQTALDKAGL
jgi:uncharacterized protein with FMN-binding domain